MGFRRIQQKRKENQPTCRDCACFNALPDKAFDGGILWGTCSSKKVNVMPKWVACPQYKKDMSWQ